MHRIYLENFIGNCSICIDRAISQSKFNLIADSFDQTFPRLYHFSSVSFDFSPTNAIRRDLYYRKKLLLLPLVGRKRIYFRMKVFIFTISTSCNYLLFD